MNRVPMWDGAGAGISVGSKLEAKTEVTQSDYDDLREIFLRYVTRSHEVDRLSNAKIRALGLSKDFVSKGESLEIDVTSNRIAFSVKGKQSDSTKMHVSLIRVGKDSRASFFLNIKNNPISFLTGQNVGGRWTLQQLMERVLSTIEEIIGKELDDSYSFPSGLWQQVRAGNINFNSLALATYTEPTVHVDKVSRLFYFINSIYNHALKERMGNEDFPISISIETGFICRMEHGGNFPSLILEDRYVSAGKSRVRAVLTLYSKEKEVEASGDRLNSSVRILLDKRLRLDLRFTAFGLRYMRMSNLRQWNAMVERGGGVESDVMISLIENFLHRSGVLYALQFPNPYDVLSKVRGTRVEQVMEAWKQGWSLSEKMGWSAEENSKLLREHGLDLSRSWRFHLAAAAGRVQLAVGHSDVAESLDGNHTNREAALRTAFANLNGTQLASSLARVAARLRPTALVNLPRSVRAVR